MLNICQYKQLGSSKTNLFYELSTNGQLKGNVEPLEIKKSMLKLFM